jgi:hypothetical protein
MIGYIYKTTNKVNGFVYIGQHKCNFFDRKYRGSGTIFKEALDEYGWGNFTTELVCWASTVGELNKLEKFWIKEHKGQKIYNMAAGGGGGHKYIYVDLDTKLIYVGINSAAKAARIHVCTFDKWVNIDGMSRGLAEYYENNKQTQLLRTKPKYQWVTNRWVRLEARAMLKMKNPIFA